MSEEDLLVSVIITNVSGQTIVYVRGLRCLEVADELRRVLKPGSWITLSPDPWFDVSDWQYRPTLRSSRTRSSKSNGATR